MISDGAEIILKKPTCSSHGNGGRRENVVVKNRYARSTARGAAPKPTRATKPTCASSSLDVCTPSAGVRSSSRCPTLGPKHLRVSCWPDLSAKTKSTVGFGSNLCISILTPLGWTNQRSISLGGSVDRSRAQANKNTIESTALDTRSQGSGGQSSSGTSRTTAMALCRSHPSRPSRYPR